jgi:DNA-directed RNA polymerase subunit F
MEMENRKNNSLKYTDMNKSEIGVLLGELKEIINFAEKANLFKIADVCPAGRGNLQVFNLTKR